MTCTCDLFTEKEPQGIGEKLFWNHSKEMRDYRVSAVAIGALALVATLFLAIFGPVSAAITTTLLVCGSIAIVGGTIGSPVLMGIPLVAACAASIAYQILNPPDIVHVVHY